MGPPLAYCSRVSILMAARNEAATIERCLGALARLRYPAGQLRILATLLAVLPGPAWAS